MHSVSAVNSFSHLIKARPMAPELIVEMDKVKLGNQVLVRPTSISISEWLKFWNQATTLRPCSRCFELVAYRE